MCAFVAEEVFEMAVEIERTGVRYYTRAAELAKEDDVRKLLASLAEWEKEHERVFSAMRDEIDPSRSTTMFDHDEEVRLYLQAMVDGKVFDRKADPSARLTGDENVVDILKTALEMEKNSIVFYSGLLDFVPEDKGRDDVAGILREEQRHVRVITDRIAQQSGN